jgi:hypothetical protein
LHVAVVSTNSETLDGLESYLRGAGVTTTCTRNIGNAAKLGTGASAIVIFPDDFGWNAAVAALTECRSKNPHLLAVVVTSTPQRFEALTSPGDGAVPLVVPKPAWSWTILDAIRAHLDTVPGVPG